MTMLDTHQVSRRAALIGAATVGVSAPLRAETPAPTSAWGPPSDAAGNVTLLDDMGSPAVFQS
jgi:hypothetical protein